jgi:hypothetical protein
MLSSRNSNSTPVRYQNRLIGLLVEDDGQRYRFAALDAQFNLLDGSRFGTTQRALTAIGRLSHFIDQPLAANDA